MKRKSTKLEILQEVAVRTGRGRDGPLALMTIDDFARDHVRTLCEALQLHLARLYRDRDGYGYEIRITRAGRLLAAGAIEDAAAFLDSGGAMTRLNGEPPQGSLAVLLQPGSAGLVLDGLAARQYAPEMMRCVATGHLVVTDGIIRAAGRDEFNRTAAAQWIATSRVDQPEAPSPLPASRVARHRAGKTP